MGEREPSGAPKPKLFDRVRDALRARHYSSRTEKVYIHWIRRYILFQDKRHPMEIGAPEVTAFPPRSRFETPPTLAPIAAPTLAIWGAEDPYVLEERLHNSARTVTGPWRYERFDDAGHWVQLDQPDKFNRLLIEFLRS